MASLHRDTRGKSPFWYVSYRTPDGHQRFRSTKERDRKKAEAFAAAINASLGKAKAGALTETAARSILADLYQEINGQALRFLTIEAWFGACLRRVQKLRGRTTHQRYQAVIAHFLRFITVQKESRRPDELQRVPLDRIVTGSYSESAGSVMVLHRKLNRGRRHNADIDDRRTNALQRRDHGVMEHRATHSAVAT